MFELGHGNLLEADAEALVNTVNCVGIMGKGIALQFKQAFPDNFKAYQTACRHGEVVPGKMFIFSTNKLLNPKYIVNFPTKRHWKQPSQLGDIESGLVALIEDIQKLEIKSIAIPPLGCGNGGLDWALVKPIIERAFLKLPHVRVLLFEPKGAPSPEKMPIGTEKPELTRARALLIRLLELYGIPGYELTLLEIQKLAYFLQAAGEPLKLRFEKQKFGPYAHNLNHVLQKLEGHYIQGYGDHAAVNKQVRTLPGASEQAVALLENLPEAQERLEKVSKLIQGFETPYGMELLSTVHWLANNEDPDVAKDQQRAIVGVQSWSERKAGLFRDQHIKTAWKKLSENGWMEEASHQCKSTNEQKNIPGLCIMEYPNVKEIAERLDCNMPTGIAFMPRNFDEAMTRCELLHEDTVKTLRTLMREHHIPETKFEREGERFRYIQENAYLEGIVLFVGATALAQDPNLLSVTLNMISNYLTDSLKGAGRLLKKEQTTKLDIVVESKRGCKRLNYKGPVEGIKDLESVIRAIQEEN